MEDLRQDRIRDEAALTADPLRLMRLSGISGSTAVRYITAAHPGRTAEAPRERQRRYRTADPGPGKVGQAYLRCPQMSTGEPKRPVRPSWTGGLGVSMPDSP